MTTTAPPKYLSAYPTQRSPKTQPIGEGRPNTHQVTTKRITPSSPIPFERSATPTQQKPSQQQPGGGVKPARSNSPYNRTASSQSQGMNSELTPSATTITTTLFSEHERLGEARSIAVVGSRVWCADKERIVIRDIQTAEVMHIIHKTQDMGFIWTLERVRNHIWVGCSDGHIRVLNRNTYEESHDLCSHTGGVYCVMHTGGRVYSGGADFQLLQWNAKTASLIRKFPSPSSAIRCLTPLDYSRVASGSDDGVVRVWEVATGALLQEWLSHSSSVRALTYIVPTDRIWSAGEDGRIKVWMSQNGSNVQTLSGHAGTITQLLSFCGSVWSGGVDGAIVVWDSVTGNLVERMRQHNGYMTCLAQVHRSDLGTIWSMASDKVLKRWTCQCVSQIENDEAVKLQAEDLSRRLLELGDENTALTGQNQQLGAELKAQQVNLLRTMDRQQPAADDKTKQIVADLERAKAEAYAMVEQLRGKAELCDEIGLRLREREGAIVRLELDRAGFEDRLMQMTVQLSNQKAIQDQYVEASREAENAKGELAKALQALDEEKLSSLRQSEALFNAGFTDAESLLRRMRGLEEDLRQAREASERRWMQIWKLDGIQTPKTDGCNSAVEALPRPPTSNYSPEADALREELTAMRSGQDYNGNLLLEMQAKMKNLENQNSRLREDLFAKDAEISHQAAILKQQRSPARGLSDGEGTPRPVADPAKAPSANLNLAVVSALREINTHSLALYTTIGGLKDEASQAKGSQNIRSAVFTQELQRAYNLSQFLCSTVGRALSDISPDLGSDRLPGHGPPEATLAREETQTPTKRLPRSSTPPVVAHTLTSQQRLLRAQQKPTHEAASYVRSATPPSVRRVVAFGRSEDSSPNSSMIKPPRSGHYSRGGTPLSTLTRTASTFGSSK